jgi:hypothetical protein
VKVAGAVSSANPVPPQPAPDDKAMNRSLSVTANTPRDLANGPSDPVKTPSEHTDGSDIDDMSFESDSSDPIKKCAKTPSKKRSVRSSITPSSAKWPRFNVDKNIASQMERMNAANEADTELFKSFLKSQQAAEPDFLANALKILQVAEFLEEVGAHNLIPAINLMKKPTEAKFSFC